MNGDDIDFGSGYAGVGGYSTPLDTSAQPQVSPYPTDTSLASGVSPYPATATASPGTIDPALQSYLAMLGLTGNGGAPASVNPSSPAATAALTQLANPTATVAASPLTSGQAPAWLGLGISGQVSQEGQGIPALAPNTATTAYTLPTNLQPQQQSSSNSGGGGLLGGGGGGLLGGFL